MKDVNYPLRKAYRGALTPLGYPVAYNELENDSDAPIYIIISDLNSFDNRTKNSKQTETGIRVTIHSWVDVYNPGKTVDEVAEEVYQAVYPESRSTIDLSADGLQVLTTSFNNDTVSYGELGSRRYTDRIISFKHKIFIQ